MDVKNVFRGIFSAISSPISESKRREFVQGETKTSSDRDPGTGQDQHQQDAPHKSLSEEEMKQVLKHLEELPGVKDNSLRIRFERKDGIAVVYVEDRDGKVVRRIPEAELSLIKSRSQENKATGNLINRAM
jgi:uncharacterized FlaG/YvyC family protein